MFIKYGPPLQVVLLKCIFGAGCYDLNIYYRLVINASETKPKADIKNNNLVITGSRPCIKNS